MNPMIGWIQPLVDHTGKIKKGVAQWHDEVRYRFRFYWTFSWRIDRHRKASASLSWRMDYWIICVEPREIDWLSRSRSISWAVSTWDLTDLEKVWWCSQGRKSPTPSLGMLISSLSVSLPNHSSKWQNNRSSGQSHVSRQESSKGSRRDRSRVLRGNWSRLLGKPFLVPLRLSCC